LEGGRTAHSTFKLPLDITSLGGPPTCNISKGTGAAKLLQMCELIVWDECTMAHKKSLEALDNTLQDLKGIKKPMGGTVILLAGDFRQILPVIPNGTPADELNACLKASYLWNHVSKLSLTTNMRVQLHNSSTAQSFSKQLLALGDGRVQCDPSTGCITFSADFCSQVQSVVDLLDNVFPNIENNYSQTQWLCERAILAPKNNSVHRLNLLLLEKIPVVSRSFFSVDTICDQSEAIHYPTEFLNSLQPTGLPQHHLQLKIGAPIMLLRNLDPPKLCNGTRLTIKNLYPHLIEATILSGCGKGEDVFIPRIPLIPSNLPFNFRRLQFPVSLAFAMTINKSQGQTIKVVGLNLIEPCFSHGQLYVACSRVSNPKNLFVLAPSGSTKNIVYQGALT
jgi:hypothetical protein